MRAGTSRKTGKITSELRAEHRKKAEAALPYLFFFQLSKLCRKSSVKGKHMKPKQTVPAGRYENDSLTKLQGVYGVTGGERSRFLKPRPFTGRGF